MIFALFNLETLTDLDYSFRDHNRLAFFNLDTLTVLAYSIYRPQVFRLI